MITEDGLGEPLCSLDRIVNVYARIREAGQPSEEAWRYAALVVKGLMVAEFRDEAMAGIAEIPTVNLPWQNPKP